MRKIFALALGVLLIGSAMPAQAASSIDFSGAYTAFYFSEGNLQRLSDAGTDGDNYFANRLELNITFQPTDEVSVVWRLRGPDFQRWGAEGFNNPDGDQGGLGLHTRFLYGQVVQDWGTIRVGKLDHPYNLGLASLGYLPASADWAMTQIAPFDGWEDPNGIFYTHDWENGFGLNLHYGKVGTNTWDSSDDADADFDRFLIEPRYNWGSGGASLGLIYDRNYMAAVDRADGSKEDNYTMWYLNPAVTQSFGDVTFHVEGKIGRGKVYNAGNEKVDVSGYGFYLDGDYDYGDGNVTLAGWWVSGSKMSDTEKKSAVGIGTDFYPLLVAYELSSFGYGRQSNSAITLANDPDFFFSQTAAVPVAGSMFNYRNIANEESADDDSDGYANHWAIGLFGNHRFTEDIAMHYGLAYLQLNHANYMVLDEVGGGRTYQSKDLGWEVDLGFSFMLLENLEFTTSFGYMFNGDAYRQFNGYVNGQSTWLDPDDTYVWANTLSFYF